MFVGQVAKAILKSMLYRQHQSFYCKRYVELQQVVNTFIGNYQPVTARWPVRIGIQ